MRRMLAHFERRRDRDTHTTRFWKRREDREWHRDYLDQLDRVESGELDAVIYEAFNEADNHGDYRDGWVP